MKKMNLVATILCLTCSGCTSIAQEKERTLLTEQGVENAYPRLSADKKRILYQSNRTGSWQLFIMDIASSKHTRITDDKFNNNFPDWSADNNYISFVSDRDGNEEIYMINTDGTNLRRLTNDKERDIHPYFSPDGRYLLFNSTRGNGSLDIFRYELKTGKTEQLTNTPNDHETCARYAKDMKRIVYLKNNDETDDVFMLNLTNRLTDNISKTPYITDGWPMFNSKGDKIYYSSLKDGKYSIYRLNLEDGSLRQLTFAGANEEDARVCVAADESIMIYNKRVGKTIDIRLQVL